MIMKIKYIFLTTMFAVMTLFVQSQSIEKHDDLFIPYRLNYLPYGSPTWMAMLASPDGLDYRALVDSFNVYLLKNPGARRKSPETKQVVNHFRRYQKAYVNFVGKDGIIRLPKATMYHAEMNAVLKGGGETGLMREHAKATGMFPEIEPWEVISPIITYDYRHKKVTPAQANIQRLRASRSNPDVIYCGSETGMIFRSDDKGANWSPCANGEWMSGEITTIDVSSTNHKRVIIGGGGVFWLSDDEGNTWRDVTPIKSKYARTSVAMFHPADDNIILAGDRSQLWRSIDGGVSWQWMLQGMVFDIKFSVQNPDVCYVAIEQDATVKLYKSSDAGESWNLLDIGGEPLISARIGLSEAPTGADYVYMWACRRNHLSQPGPLYFSGPPLLFKSTDGGNSFEVIDPVGQLENVDVNGGQGYYDLVCSASATDPETLLVGIIQLYRSTDGGKTLENQGGYYGKYDLHCDMQSLQTNGTGDTWLSTDGGVIYSRDFFATHAEPRLKGLYSSEMWGFDQGWNEDVMVGGRNHNGNMSQLDRYNGASIFMSGSERPTGYVFLSNPRKVAFSDSENVIMPDDWRDDFIPFLDYWTYPKESSQHGIGFVFDPRYAKSFYIVQGNSDEEYRTLWRTRDDGASFSTVYTFDEPVSSIAISRSNPDKIVVSTWGRLLYSLDAGITFHEYIIPDEMRNSINYKIEIHPRDENEIWLSDGNEGGIWCTRDNGHTWDKLDKGLNIPNWEGNVENHKIGRFFLTGNEKNAVYAIAYTMGYLNESYTTPRGKVLYRDDTTDGWVNYSDGLPKVINLNRMLPFYKEGVIRLATSNGIWQRELMDSDFVPIAQPIILNVGDGDNRKNDYPRVLELDSYSIVNQNNAQWQWTINPAPVAIDSYEIRNPRITIEPNQTYDISLTVTTPSGCDTKCIEGMIRGDNPVPENTSIDNLGGFGKDMLLLSGNVVTRGETLLFEPRNLVGKVKVCIYDSKGNVVYDASSLSQFNIETSTFGAGVYFYMVTDGDGYREVGKLLVKE